MPSGMHSLPRLEPVQQDLPLPAPPHRPFFALARDVQIGNATSKFVYMVIASYCPVMARAWSAVGRVRRKTLQKACEFKKMDTLDLHLRALRTARYLDWSRTGRASEFIVNLSPLQILGSQGRSAIPRNGGSEDPARVGDPPLGGVSVTAFCGADPPLNGGSAGGRVPRNGGSARPSASDPPLNGGSAPLFGDSDPPPSGGSARSGVSGRSPRNGGSESPSRGRFRNPVSRSGVVVEGSQGVHPAAAAAGRVGLGDRQVKLLEVASDRLGAAACPDLWRAASPEALQRQMSAAVRYRDRLQWVAHSHAVESEVLCAYGVVAGSPWMTVVQRCACASARIVRQTRSTGRADLLEWSLCGFVASHAVDTAFLGALSDAPGGAEFIVSLADWSDPYSLADIGILAESGLPPPAVVGLPARGARAAADPGVECPACGAVVGSAELTDIGCVVCGVTAAGLVAPAGISAERVVGGDG